MLLFCKCAEVSLNHLLDADEQMANSKARLYIVNIPKSTLLINISGESALCFLPNLHMPSWSAYAAEYMQCLGWRFLTYLKETCYTHFVW